MILPGFDFGGLASVSNDSLTSFGTSNDNRPEQYESYAYDIYVYNAMCLRCRLSLKQTYLTLRSKNAVLI